MAKGICSFDGCIKPHEAKGWCRLHYLRWRRHGDPAILRPTKPRRMCSVEGCERRYLAAGYCSMHWQRAKRNGEPGIAGQVKACDGRGKVNRDGYRVLFIKGHPLATTHGEVMEHRVVLYAVLGPADRPCYHCGHVVSWSKNPREDYQDALQVDHLDFCPLNNDPANLVPSCGPCNNRRKAPR